MTNIKIVLIDIQLIRFSVAVEQIYIDCSLFIVEVYLKSKPTMGIVGDVDGRVAIIVEDMIDDVPGLIQAADILFDHGASKVYAVATHALFACDAPLLIENSRIAEVIITNTVPHELAKDQCSKIKIVDISLLLSEAIRRIHNQESMGYLFRNVEPND